MENHERLRQCGWMAVTAAGVVLVLAGFFSPWIDHPAAGLALTGFEIGEWIKFAPEIRVGTSGLSRTGFYWPAPAAAAGMAVFAAASGSRKALRWILLCGAAVVALLPFPLVEEISNLAGIRSNLGRLGLIGLGLLTVGAAAIRGQHLPPWLRGTALIAIGGVGLAAVSVTFAAAEPIIEQLYNRLIDPGAGLIMVQSGLIALIAGGIWHLAVREHKKAIP